MTRKKYQALSPDGFTFDYGVSYYTSKKKMFEAFDKWKEQYKQQGYYSSATYGRILFMLPKFYKVYEIDTTIPGTDI